MALSTADAARLAQYRQAYADLITGQMVTEVTVNGRSTKFGQANKGDLVSEIARLEALEQCPTSARRRGAVGFNL